MKTFKFLFAALLFTILSCNTDNESQPKTFQENNLSLDISKIENLLASNTINQNDVITLKKPLNSDNLDIERKYSEIWLDGKDLNNYTKHINADLDILAITIYSSVKTNLPKGVVLHYYSKSRNNIFIDIYDIEKNILIEKEGYPMTVNDVIFEDLTFIGNKYYNSENINLVSASNFSLEGIETNYNDLYIGYITDTFKVHKETIIKIAKSCQLKDINLARDDFNISSDAPIDALDGFGRGCALNHRCQNGDGSMSCGNNGCVNICPRSEVGFYAGAHNLSNYQSTINNFLPFSSLYQLRDRLNTTLMGREYVNLYYALGGHFANSLNTEMIIDIAQMSPDIAVAVQSYLNGNIQDALINTSLANNLNSLLQKSKLNSNSFNYRNSIDVVIGEIESFEELKLPEAQQQLSTGIISF